MLRRCHTATRTPLILIYSHPAYLHRIHRCIRRSIAIAIAIAIRIAACSSVRAATAAWFSETTGACTL